MRLIDADALILSLQIDQEICFGCPEPEWLDELIQVLDNAPTAEVVRCKDCKHRFYDEPNEAYMCDRHEYGESFGDDDFCSYGERRDESEVEE